MNFDECVKLQSIGDLKKAELGYRQLIQEENVSPDVLCNLGIICAKTGRDEEALSLFKKTVFWSRSGQKF